MTFHKTNEISSYNTLLSFSFNVLKLIWAFAFGTFKSWPQNFGLVQTDSKFHTWGEAAFHWSSFSSSGFSSSGFSLKKLFIEFSHKWLIHWMNKWLGSMNGKCLFIKSFIENTLNHSKRWAIQPADSQRKQKSAGPSGSRAVAVQSLRALSLWPTLPGGRLCWKWMPIRNNLAYYAAETSLMMKRKQQ